MALPRKLKALPIWLIPAPAPRDAEYRKLDEALLRVPGLEIELVFQEGDLPPFFACYDLRAIRMVVNATKRIRDARLIAVYDGRQDYYAVEMTLETADPTAAGLAINAEVDRWIDAIVDSLTDPEDDEDEFDEEEDGDEDV